jgi:hypothetical protein
MSTYHLFNSPPNRGVYWDDHGRVGAGLYYFVPNITTNVDIVINGSFVLDEPLPPPMETVLPTHDNTQKQEESYHPVGDHPDDPKTRTRRFKGVHKKNPNNKTGRKITKPGELDHDYYREYCLGVDLDDFYYRSEKVYMNDYNTIWSESDNEEYRIWMNEYEEEDSEDDDDAYDAYDAAYDTDYDDHYHDNADHYHDNADVYDIDMLRVYGLYVIA